MTASRSTFAGLLAASPSDRDAPAALRRLRRFALAPLAAACVLLAGWSSTAPLSGAVIAEGKLKVELNRKTVQHREGGIVQQILVRDGERVSAGQALVVITDVRNDAELSLLQDQLIAERVRHARSSAEAALAAPPAVVEGETDADAREHLRREIALFEARRRTLDEHVSSLERQIRDARSQSAALTAQIQSAATAAQLADEELALNEKLVREGYVQRARVLQLQRTAADYRSRVSEAQSDLAAAQQRIGELQARIAQARNQYQQQATDEAKDSAARIRELEERLRPSRDQAERRYVRAPVDGQVMALRVSSPGEVVGAGDAILDLVPTHEKLVVEARIRPLDVNHVREGSAADVRLSGFDSRTTPLLPGAVAFVSPDRITDPETGAAWFVATIEVDATALQRHPEIRLQAGIPAEIYVKTPERTLLQYLAKPLTVFASRAMREP